MGYEGVEWINMAGDWDLCEDLKSFWVPKDEGFLVEVVFFL